MSKRRGSWARQSQKKRKPRLQRAAPPVSPVRPQRTTAHHNPLAKAEATYGTEGWFPVWANAYEAIMNNTAGHDDQEPADSVAEDLNTLGVALAALPPYFIDASIMNLICDRLYDEPRGHFASVVPWSVFESKRGLIFSNAIEDPAIHVHAVADDEDMSTEQKEELDNFSVTFRLDAMTFAVESGTISGVQAWLAIPSIPSSQEFKAEYRTIPYVVNEATRQHQTDIGISWALEPRTLPPEAMPWQLPELSLERHPENGLRLAGSKFGTGGLDHIESPEGLAAQLKLVGVDFVHCAAEWMAQWAAPRRPRRVTRAQQRQAAQEGIRAPTTGVRIVDLRRREPSSDSAVDTTQRAAPDHRFNVRGHWRNQAHGPKRSLRKRVWVKEYIKGPDHLPVRLSPIAFRINRA
ncbi:hypothetical protein [uncultured Mediterranean phage]|nr:hypothetical protein [uncultured Mediterranean phage]